MAGTEDFVINIRANVEEFKQGMADVSNNVKDFGEGLKNVGGGMTKALTGPILAFGGASIVAFNKVDGALDTIITKTGATGDAAEELTETFNNVAGRVPEDLQAVGDAVGEVNTQFGFMGKELETNTELMLQFANINGTDVTQASILAKGALSMFKMEAEQLPEVLDAFTKAAQDSGQSTDYLMDTVTKNGPIFKSMGLDVAQSAALVGNFEKSGIDAAKAMSYLTKAQGVYAKDGLSLQDGLKGTIEAIKNSKSETEALALAQETFGIKGAGQMVNAIQSGALSLDELAEASKNAAGAVTSTYNETLDPIDQSKIAMNQATLAMAEVGATLQEALLPFMLKLTEVLSKVNEWFKGLSPEMKTTILVIAGLVAAVGPLLMVLGMAVSAIGSIGSALAVVAGAFSLPLVGIALLIAAVVGIGVIIYKNWDAIKEYTVNAFTGIKDFFTEWGTKIKEKFLTDVGAVTEFFSGAWNKVKEFTVNVFTSLVEFFTSWGAKILTVFTAPITSVLTFFTSVFTEMREKTVANLTALITFFTGFITAVKTGITGGFTAIVNGVVGFATTLFNKAKEMGSNIINGIVGGITGGVGKAVSAIKNVAGNILGGFREFLNINSPSKVFMSSAGSIVEGITEGISRNAGDGITAIKDLAGELTGAFNPELGINTEGIAGSLDNLRGKQASVVGTMSAAKTQTIILEGDLAPLVTRVKTDVATEVQNLTSGGLV